MNELAIQKYLRTGLAPCEGNTLVTSSAEDRIEALKTIFGINAKRHPRFPNLVLFKYDQIASPMHEPIVQDCRGIILDEQENWAVVSMAFRKFFNHGEGHAAEIDWSTAKVQEKVDGSLCVLYPYAGEWHVATSGTPDAGGQVYGFDTTFEKLFWDTYRDHNYDLPSLPEHDDLCFMFEMSGPLNRIVVRHRETKLTLLGARQLDTLQEFVPEDASRLLGLTAPHRVRRVQEFPLQSFEQIAHTFTAMNPLEQEGYVVVDRAFNRVKVKHPGYVALHRVKDGMSPRAILDIARKQEVPEVVLAFPEFKEELEKSQAKLRQLVADLEGSYEQLKHHETQKAFALEAVKTRYSPALFALRAGKASSVREYLAGIHIDRLMDVLGTSSA